MTRKQRQMFKRVTKGFLRLAERTKTTTLQLQALSFSIEPLVWPREKG